MFCGVGDGALAGVLREGVEPFVYRISYTTSTWFLNVEDLNTMAKALFGHVNPGMDPRLVAEVTRLRRRVRDLEDELARTRLMEDALSDGILTSSDVDDLREPALA